MEYAFEHFLISEEVYNKFKVAKEECKFHLFGTDEWDNMPNVNKCYGIWLNYYYAYSGNLNPYNIYGKCYRESDRRIDQLLELTQKGKNFNKYGFKSDSFSSSEPIDPLDSDYEMIKSKYEKTLNQDDLDKDLNDNLTQLSSQRYKRCTHC